MTVSAVLDAAGRRRSRATVLASVPDVCLAAGGGSIAPLTSLPCGGSTRGRDRFDLWLGASRGCPSDAGRLVTAPR
jgi:hypothetical protein